MRLHPDKTQAPHAEEAFKAVSEAFDVLGNARKRAQYDLVLKGGGDGRSTAFNFGDLGDLDGDNEGQSGPSVVDAWCQLSLLEFTVYIGQQGPMRLLLNVAAVVYVVLVLSKALLYEVLCPTCVSHAPSFDCSSLCTPAPLADGAGMLQRGAADVVLRVRGLWLPHVKHSPRVFRDASVGRRIGGADRTHPVCQW